MIRNMPRLELRRFFLTGICVLTLIVTVRAGHEGAGGVHEDSFSGLAVQVSSAARSLWDRLFPKCSEGIALKHLDKGSGFVVSDQKKRSGGKLGDVAPMFSRIECEGGLSILLDPKGPEGRVRAFGSDVNAMDSGDILYLKGARGRSPYDVVISGKRLVSQINKVSLHDACSLRGAGLHQSSWYLNSDTTGEIVLRGVFDDCSIVQNRENVLDMYWAGSDGVDVVAKSGVMRLSGSVARSRLRFSGNSQALLKQLRTKSGWLSASGHAFVEVFGEARWSVFSSGHAQVVADGVPVHSSDTARDASVFVVDD